MTTKREAEVIINRVIVKLTAEQVDALVPEGGDYTAVAEAVMAWWALLFATGAVRKGKRYSGPIGSAALVLGTLVKYAYALGKLAGRNGE